MTMTKDAALQKKKRKDFIPYFLGFVIFLYCTVHLVSFTAKTAQETHSARVRRALGKKMCVCVVYFIVCLHLPQCSSKCLFYYSNLFDASL